MKEYEEVEEICFTREELCNLLDTTESNMRNYIKRKTLDKELCKKGYILIRDEKIGRNKVYYLKKLKQTDWERLQEAYNIMEQYRPEHTEYSYNRLLEPDIVKGKLLKKSNMQGDNASRQRANKYDRILEAEGGIVRNDDYEYVMVITKTKEYKQITKEEYINFWRDQKDFNDRKQNLKYKKKRYLISGGEYDYLIRKLEEEIEITTGKFAIKVVSYSGFVNNLELLNMIKKHKEERA